MNQLLAYGIENVKPHVVISAMIKLSGEMVNAADSNLIGGFVRIYHRAIGFVSASPKGTWANVWYCIYFYKA